MGSYPWIAGGSSADPLEEVAQDNLRLWIGRQVPQRCNWKSIVYTTIVHGSIGVGSQLSWISENVAEGGGRRGKSDGGGGGLWLGSAGSVELCCKDRGMIDSR